MSKWEMVKLGDIGKIVTGNTPSTKVAEYYENYDIPFYKPNDINEKTILMLDKSSTYLDKRAEKKLRILPKNSVLVTCIGIIGKVAVTTNKYSATNQQINAIIPNDEIIQSKFLAYALFKQQILLQDKANAPVVPIINKKDFSETKIPLPPLETQKQIADELDKITSLIEKRKQQIEKLDLLIKSKFVEMFGDIKTNSKKWIISQFSDVAKIDTIMTTDFELYSDYPHIGIDCIEKDTGKILGYKLVKESDLKSGKYIFDKRHLIYSKIRPNLNKVAKPMFSGLCSADSYPILPLNLCHIDYLVNVLRSDFFLDYILGLSSRTNIPKVNKNQLNSVCLPLPPIDLQKKFAEYVEKVEKIKYNMENGLEKLEILYKERMQNYFE